MILGKGRLLFFLHQALYLNSDPSMENVTKYLQSEWRTKAIHENHYAWTKSQTCLELCSEFVRLTPDSNGLKISNPALAVSGYFHFTPSAL